MGVHAYVHMKIILTNQACAGLCAWLNKYDCLWENPPCLHLVIFREIPFSDSWLQHCYTMKNSDLKPAISTSCQLYSYTARYRTEKCLECVTLIFPNAQLGTVFIHIYNFFIFYCRFVSWTHCRNSYWFFGSTGSNNHICHTNYFTYEKDEIQ